MNTSTNKAAIVTGAGSGIGLVLTKELIVRRAKVWLTDIDKKQLKKDLMNWVLMPIHVL